MTERATTDANDAGDPATLDWLPERAIGIGRALVPVLAAFGRDEATAELARLAGGFAADPPIVGVHSRTAVFSPNDAATACTPTIGGSAAKPPASRASSAVGSSRPKAASTGPRARPMPIARSGNQSRVAGSPASLASVVARSVI